MLANEVYNSIMRPRNEVPRVVGTTALKAIPSLPTLYIPLKTPPFYVSRSPTLSSLGKDTTRLSLWIVMRNIMAGRLEKKIG
jgi:hypothetical protein